MKTRKRHPKGLHPAPLRFGGASQDPSGLRRWRDADDLHWSVQHWATRLNVCAPAVQIRAMRRKWASLSRRGRLTLNAELLNLPRDLGEYAIVHELVHLLVPRHSKLFKSYLHAYLPDWEKRAERLKHFSSRSGRSAR